jgi:hypothetical protein
VAIEKTYEALRGGWSGLVALVVLGVGIALVASSRVEAQAPPASAPTPRAVAGVDFTGYWVAVISEDWRWRMITPARGDFPSIPFNLNAQLIAEAWDPAKDEAAGEQCRAYGAPGLIRGPTRLQISWLDDSTLKLETDYGMQTRIFRFSPAPAAPPERTWQGVSTAEWIGTPAADGRRRSLKTVTTQLRPGYLRKNGVPYSAATVFTEYWDVQTDADGAPYLVDTNIVDDPVYLQTPWVTALHFTKEPDGSKWDPTPCDARF